ncbi:hypothetical protein CR513_04853, partial [Mucuna pruriens]
MDMVMSMLSNLSLPLSLWMHALKTTMHLLNRVPSKSISKIPFEFRTGRTPKIRIHNPQEKKLDARTIFGYFIGYQENLKVGVLLVVMQGNNEEEEHNNKLMIQNEPIEEEP